MAGGYFDLPISRSASDEGSSKLSTSRSFTSSLPSDSFQGQPVSEVRSFSDDSAQDKYRNAGILKSTNRVNLTASESEPRESTGSMVEFRLDRRGTELPQKPLPTASIPGFQEKVFSNSQLAPELEDDRSTTSVDVTGLTISTRTTPLGTLGEYELGQGTNGKGQAICFAHERAPKLASLLNCPQNSPKQSPRCSSVSSIASTPAEVAYQTEDGENFPVISFPEKQLFDNLIDEHAVDFLDGQSTPPSGAHYLVNQMSSRDLNCLSRLRTQSPGLHSRGQDSASEYRNSYESAERTSHYRSGILSSLLKLYDQPHYNHHRSRGRYGRSRQGSSSEFSGRGLSPDSVWKPHRKWYDKSTARSSISMPGSSRHSGSPFAMLTRSRSSGATIPSLGRSRPKTQLEDEIHITVHVAELLSRQRYLIRLCRALMKYGAPTHRLEEYMRMTARVIQIDSQFLYIPGCMIISFDDASTHTTEVKVVRSSQGIDLGKLADVHEIYKEVIHDVIGVEEAIQRLDEVMKKQSKFHILFLIFAHGCASASVGPFAFNARPVDIPVAFLLGCLLGVLQLILSTKSSLYSNVFEISAAVLTSFLARAFGSIKYHGEPLFCFSALAQSAIALILPGYTVLCASLELQSRSIVAGSVRMVYAIIYSLFLGFGITIGTAVYGLLDSQASTAYTCPASPIHNEYLQRFPFVIIFTVCLAIVNRAKWKQMPIMIVISLAGYVTNYFSAKRFYSNTQVSNALGAFVIGVMGNFYSRLRHGLAAAAMLPAIFVLVPSGLAASGSLISGITSAEEMTQSPYAVVNNGTQGFVDAAKKLSADEAKNQSYGVVFDIGYGMIQVAIGTTVGLFLAALMIYPLGKKRSGLFSF
ncbi:hypothetical protein N7491_011164 [Penicillium cf. griseofulvum]|uniref:DUF1212 domain membrane protein Prm10 n=1 Tax=Penicillium cf. griseofulvum TaxID=2972120 RepID=A0A9W9N224_9EURO|nr:hypothetical protein N7472_001483 [Penicillium cf. griseofulvum]KAJ5422719.1 hypothetical protein N7491_011164 [Penicillium cf. griseofulvum]KAJ5428895.1 hypothetical protein N7445_010349 [Penicillium cf. griseofulvum]